MKLSILFGVSFCLVLAAGAARGEVDVIDFAELPAGTIASEVYSRGGAGPVRIFGLNPRLGASMNAAVVFDSSNPTGEDQDLGSPNESFEVDGQPGPGRGEAGVEGTEFQNATALGKLLIIAEDLVDADGDGLVDDPDDMDHRGNLYTFDFSAIGTITADRLMLIDVESNEGPAMARLYDASDREIQVVDLPVTGDNGMATVDFEPVPGVAKITVSLGGSGAISGFRFEIDPAPAAPPVAIAELPQTTSRLPSIFLAAVLLICVGATLRMIRP